MNELEYIIEVHRASERRAQAMIEFVALIVGSVIWIVIEACR